MKSSTVLLAVFLLACPLAANAEDLDFTIINATGASLVGFYVSHSKSEDWGDNLMPDGHVLPPGNEVGVLIIDGRTTCMYDIRADFQDGTYAEDFEIDVCELHSYTFE